MHLTLILTFSLKYLGSVVAIRNNLETAHIAIFLTSVFRALNFSFLVYLHKNLTNLERSDADWIKIFDYRYDQNY